MHKTKNPVTYFLSALLIGFSFLSQAQTTTPGSFLHDYMNLLNLKNQQLNDFSFNNSIYYGFDTLAWDVWGQFTGKKNVPGENSFQWIDPQFDLHLNSTYARSYNDGPIWKGKGLTPALSLGFQGNFGKFYYTAAPAFFYSQNAPFDLANIQPTFNPYNYQFATYGYIDYVQRYGDQSFGYVSPGQSEVRFIDGKFTFGLSTQNISWGPAVFNPILRSKNAEGFPHLDLGFFAPYEIKIGGINFGTVNGKFIAGTLRRSKYHNSNSGGAHRYVTGFTFDYQHPRIDGLKIGLNRALYKNLKDFKFQDIISSVYLIPDRIDTTFKDYYDQMASVTVEYQLKESGFRVYTEIAKNDFNGNLRDFFVDFGHSTAYTLGLQKVHDLSNGKTLLATYEHTRLSRTKGNLYRPEPPFYVHFLLTDGYTNNGQTVGAGIGPGSVTDRFGLDFYHKKGVWGFNLGRIVVDNDFFITNYGFHVVQDQDFSNRTLRDNEYTIGMKYARLTDRWMIGLDVQLSYRLNWYYIFENDKFNLGSTASVRYFLTKAK